MWFTVSLPYILTWLEVQKYIRLLFRWMWYTQDLIIRGNSDKEEFKVLNEIARKQDCKLEVILILLALMNKIN